MSTTATTTSDAEQPPAETIGPALPKRADARRNHAKVIAAARQAFTEGGAETSLEEIARRAGVGIGTLYRNFPNRQALLEAVYVGELQDLCHSAEDAEALEPWEALEAWLRRFVGYMVTKQALASELLNYMSMQAPLFATCRAALYTAGEPLITRAHAAGVLRGDTDLPELIQLFGGIAKIQTADAAQIEHMVDIALDGLRPRACD